MAAGTAGGPTWTPQPTGAANGSQPGGERAASCPTLAHPVLNPSRAWQEASEESLRRLARALIASALEIRGLQNVTAPAIKPARRRRPYNPEKKWGRAA